MWCTYEFELHIVLYAHQTFVCISNTPYKPVLVFIADYQSVFKRSNPLLYFMEGLLEIKWFCNAIVYYCCDFDWLPRFLL